MSSTNWLYLQSEPQLWTVGFYDGDGKWRPESDHGSAAEAARQVIVLNGGTPQPMYVPLRANPKIVQDWSLWYHECGHVEAWPDCPTDDQLAAGYGPHPQGCDACESGDSGEGWQKLFVQVNTGE